MFGLHPTNRLLAWDQGELPPAAAARVARHVQSCAHCQAQLESLRFAAQAVRETPLHHAPDSLWSAIEPALQQAESEVGQAVSPARMWLRLAIPAAAVLILIICFFAFRPRHPTPGWAVARIEPGGQTATGTLGVGQWLVTGPASRARVSVSEIGEVDVEPNSRLRLLRARPADNRLSLAKGAISARIWAPPRLFFVETPSAVAVDLGCAYRLQVDEHGAGLLRVTMGWVELEDRGRESMVPAGAVCRMRPGFGPGTPYFEDAPAVFANALARFDFANDANALPLVLESARPRDAFTLVHLLARVAAPQRPPILDRLTALAPLPDGITRQGALAADPQLLRRWIDQLAW